MSYRDRRHDERRGRNGGHHHGCGDHDHDCGRRDSDCGRDHDDCSHHHYDCGHDHDDCGRDHHDCGRDRRRGGGDFDEKRIIDTIVRLVAEHVGGMLEEHQASAHRRDEGGDEKRLVDLIVRLVSEHVQEIVARELDRRLGKRPLGEGDAPPASDSPEPDQP